MAGYRYWQIRMLHSGDGTYNQLAYFEMRDEVGGANLATNSAQASMTDIGFAGSGVIGDLFVDSSSIVLWQQSNNVQITYDFGLGGDRELLEIVLRAGPANASRTPRLILIRRSDDGVNWEVAWAVYYTTWAVDQKETFTRPFLPDACRYWAMAAIQIEAATQFLMPSEIILRQVPGGPSIATGGTAFMTHEDAGQPASNAFDGNTATYASNSATAYRDMIGYDFGADNAQIVRVFEATSRETVNFTRMPEDGCVLRSNNFQDWEAVSSFNDLTWSSAQTQALYEAPFLIKDVIVVYGFEPLPAELLQFVPDAGIRETWEWLTTVNITYGGNEQRIARRSTPRYRYQVTKTLTGDDDRRAVYNLVRDNLGETVLLPLFHMMTPIVATSIVGSTELYFDPSETDIRENEYVAVLNPRTDQLTRLRITALDTFGGILSAPLTSAVNEGWYIMPTIDGRLPETAGPIMGHRIGEMSLLLPSVSKRSLVSALSSPSIVDTFDGYYVLDRPPVALRELGEEFEKGIEFIDNGTSLEAWDTAWTNPLFFGSRGWLVDSTADWLWWREFAESVLGRCKSFLLPTYRDDLPLIDEVVSPNQLVTSNVRYEASWAFNTYKRIAIDVAGTLHYRKVSAVSLIDEDRLLLTLTEDVPAGDIRQISYLNLVRFNSDQMQWDHQPNYSTMSCAIRSIDE
jgi:hypothetical protein